MTNKHNEEIETGGDEFDDILHFLGYERDCYVQVLVFRVRYIAHTAGVGKTPPDLLLYNTTFYINYTHL